MRAARASYYTRIVKHKYCFPNNHNNKRHRRYKEEAVGEFVWIINECSVYRLQCWCVNEPTGL